MAVLCCLVGVFALALSACGDDDDSGGGGGDSGAISGDNLTIYSSLPQQGASGPQAKAMENGAKIALEQRGGKIGKYKITYKPLDDSLASSGAADEGKAAQNARTAIQNKDTIGYIGEYNSGISKVTIPILNKAGIAQISPANTYVGLTTDAPGSEAGEPDKYYPTGKRNYARVVPTDTIQGAALVAAAQQDGCKSVQIWNSKTTYSAGLARNVQLSAKDQSLTVEGNEGIDPKAPNYRSLAAKIKSDCFIFTGEIESNGIQALKDAAEQQQRQVPVRRRRHRPERHGRPEEGPAGRYRGQVQGHHRHARPEELRARGQEVLRGLLREVQRRQPGSVRDLRLRVDGADAGLDRQGVGRRQEGRLA